MRLDPTRTKLDITVTATRTFDHCLALRLRSGLEIAPALTRTVRVQASIGLRVGHSIAPEIEFPGRCDPIQNKAPKGTLPHPYPTSPVGTCDTSFTFLSHLCSRRMVKIEHLENGVGVCSLIPKRRPRRIGKLPVGVTRCSAPAKLLPYNVASAPGAKAPR